MVNCSCCFLLYKNNDLIGWKMAAIASKDKTDWLKYCRFSMRREI